MTLDPDLPQQARFRHADWHVLDPARRERGETLGPAVISFVRQQLSHSLTVAIQSVRHTHGATFAWVGGKLVREVRVWPR